MFSIISAPGVWLAGLGLGPSYHHQVALMGCGGMGYLLREAGWVALRAEGCLVKTGGQSERWTQSQLSQCSWVWFHSLWHGRTAREEKKEKSDSSVTYPLGCCCHPDKGRETSMPHRHGFRFPWGRCWPIHISVSQPGAYWAGGALDPGDWLCLRSSNNKFSLVRLWGEHFTFLNLCFFTTKNSY